MVELGDSVKVAFAYATGRIEGQRDIKEKAAQALVALRGDDCDGDVALAYAEEAIRAIPEGE